MRVDIKIEGEVPELDVLSYVQAYAEEFDSRVKGRTPVRTGALRDSFHPENVNEEGFEEVSEVDYADFVENGTWKMEPRYMVRTTVEDADAIHDVVKDKLVK